MLKEVAKSDHSSPDRRWIKRQTGPRTGSDFDNVKGTHQTGQRSSKKDPPLIASSECLEERHERRRGVVRDGSVRDGADFVSYL